MFQTNSRQCTRLLIALISSAALLAACDDDPDLEPSGSDGGGMFIDGADQTDSGIVQNPDAGVVDGGLGDAGSADAAVPDPGPRYQGVAVVLSDFQSMSLTLIDRESLTVTKNGCVDSGTRAPALTKAFEGDTVLSSSPTDDGTILLIDRANATLTWVEPSDCSIVRQLDVSSGFSSNPQDALVVGNSVYVTRYAQDQQGQGSDVVVMDINSGLQSGRIPLATEATPATVWPRPDRLHRIGDRLLVSLNNISGDFSAYGTGRIVVIDLNTNQVVSRLDLPTLQNCGALASPSGSTSVAVVCRGSFSASDDGLSASGVALFADPVANPSATPTLLAASTVGRPLSIASLALLSDTAGFVLAQGVFGGTPVDAVWQFDSAQSQATRRLEGSGTFRLQSLLHDLDAQRLLIADADPANPRIEVLDISNAGAPMPASPVQASGMTGLPPQHMVLF